MLGTLFALSSLFFFFFNDTATTEIYTLSLHDALPISRSARRSRAGGGLRRRGLRDVAHHLEHVPPRSEEHTSELQSHSDLVCRLLLEKKKHFSCSACRGYAHSTSNLLRSWLSPWEFAV